AFTSCTLCARLAQELANRKGASCDDGRLFCAVYDGASVVSGGHCRAGCSFRPARLALAVGGCGQPRGVPALLRSHAARVLAVRVGGVGRRVDLVASAAWPHAAAMGPKSTGAAKSGVSRAVIAV